MEHRERRSTIHHLGALLETDLCGQDSPICHVRQMSLADGQSPCPHYEINQDKFFDRMKNRLKSNPKQRR